MMKKIVLSNVLLIVLALIATACQGVPSLVPQPAPTIAPTVAQPTAPTPTAMTEAQSTPQLPDRRKVEGALGLADLVGGIVSANNNGTLTLRRGGQPEQVQTNASTTVILPGKTSARIADIRVGDRVVVVYGKDETNTTAALLLDLPSDYNMSNVLLGAVLSAKSGMLNVRTRAGNDQVAAANDTIIANLSGDQPVLGSLKDLKPGNVVIMIGQDSGAAFNAQVIVITDQDARALLNRGRGNLPTPAPTPKPGM